MPDEPALPEIQHQLNACWSGAAAGYDEAVGHGLSSDAEHDAWLALLRELLPPAPSDVLDVGSGTGVLAFLAHELGHRVTGIDLAPGMLQAARDKAATLFNAPTFLEADGVAPPFAAASYDAVLNRHVLWNMRDPQRALRSWRRLLRPGGRLVLIDVCLRHPRQLAQPQRPTPWNDADLPAAQFASAADAVAMVERAGFVAVAEGDLSAVDAAEGQLDQNAGRYLLTAEQSSS